MNFGHKQTVEKQKQLVSLQMRLTTKTLVSILKIFLYCLLLIVVIGGFFGLGMVKGIIDNAPDVSEVSIAPSSYSTTVYDASGNEIEKLVTSGSNRVKVSIDEIPEDLQHAFIAIEDERFYEHNGIDLQGIGRAVVVALKNKNLSEGASTITQQVIKNNVFTDWTDESSIGDSIKRKIQEQYLAVQLEKVMSKETILENYLNTINLGSNTLGVEAASQRYFGKDVWDLTISECAVIAAITQNPSAYNPITFPDNNAIRREKVLKNMKEQGYITQEQLDSALADDVYDRIQTVNADYDTDSSVYSYFIDELISQVLDDLQEQKGYTYTQAYNALYSGGLSIYSTQNSTIQKICNQEMSNADNYPSTVYWSINWAWTIQHADGTVDNYSESYISYYHRTLLGESSFKLIFNTKEEALACVEDYKKYILPDGLAEGDIEYETLYYTAQPQASFSIMEQDTGYVRAIVGGRGKKEVSLSLNRATQSTRQPGSTFKILAVYAPAIDTMGYTLSTTVVDEPYYYSNGRPVSNWWGNSYKGTQTVRSAIAQSMNVIAVKVLTDITPQLGYDYLLNFGITTLVDSRTESDGSVVSDIQQALALGGITDGVTNLEMCAAYAAIANSGVYTKPVFYTQVVDSNGRVILDNTTPSTHTVIKDSTAVLLTQAMEDVVNGKGTGTACAVDGIDVAGKTGTTSSSYDLWFVGYTPQLTAAIWTGFDENKDLGSDQVYHEKLWSKIITRIYEKCKKTYNIKEFDLESDDLVKVTMCSISGKVATDNCEDTYTEYYTSGSEPTSKCTSCTSSYSDDNDSEEETTKKSSKKKNNDE
ncbi:MAG: transglycosylase domain-containing protein [Eubacterium sp.]